MRSKKENEFGEGEILQQIGFCLIMGMLWCLPAAAQAPVSLPLPQEQPVLEVHGAIASTNIGQAAYFDMDMLKTLPVTRLETTTAVTDGVSSFDGFLMRDLLDLLGVHGTTLTASALNDYSIEIAVDEFYRFDIVVAYAMDGRPLEPSDKGPLWIVYPRDQNTELQDIRYDYRWVWQLQRLDIR